MTISKREKKKLCSGCRNNRYNMGAGFCERPGIDAVVTADECWNLESATVVKKKMVSISQTPPWLQAPIKTLSCKSVSGYVFIDAKRVR
ncbi:MAG: hypothetical protein IPO08_22435 [Xanthomonadales bacterium]|nr:hypothetical protein [Xanthomonadales bacterium]